MFTNQEKMSDDKNIQSYINSAQSKINEQKIGISDNDEDMRNIEGKTSTSENDVIKESIEKNKKDTDIEKLLKDIQNSIKLNETLVGKSKNDDSETNMSISQTLTNTLSTLTTINGIKDQLCLLPLDFCMKEYYNNYVVPLIATLDQISRLSYNLASSVNILTTSPIVPVKKSEVKDTIDLIYHINEQCEEVYKVARKRINTMIECTQCK